MPEFTVKGVGLVVSNADVVLASRTVLFDMFYPSSILFAKVSVILPCCRIFYMSKSMLLQIPCCARRHVQERATTISQQIDRYC